MADVARVFTAGRSRAVRLPEKYRIDVDEVEISREGDTIVLQPKPRRDWSLLKQELAAFDAERYAECFPNEREQPPAQERPELDDLLR